MKIITPLNILTTTIGLFFAHLSIADGNTPPARFYDRKDLPEISEKMSLPKKNEREQATESFDIDRDALFDDRTEDSSNFETSAINTAQGKMALPMNISKYPVKLKRIDMENNTDQFLNITAEISENSTTQNKQY